MHTCRPRARGAVVVGTVRPRTAAAPSPSTAPGCTWRSPPTSPGTSSRRRWRPRARGRQTSPAAVLIFRDGGRRGDGGPAARLETGLLIDAVDLDALVWCTQTVFGGSYTVQSQVTHGMPVITVRPTRPPSRRRVPARP